MAAAECFSFIERTLLVYTLLELFIRNLSFGTYATFSEKLTFLTP